MQLQAIELADDLSRNRIYWKHFKIHRIDEKLLNQAGKIEEGQGAERASQVALVVKNPPAKAGRLKRRWFDHWVMNRSMPGLPVRHQLPEFSQTHVH